ncbi:hypothetical protein FOXYSP1_13272 [Fusarium oxysporum f. sp. phaseoli]
MSAPFLRSTSTPACPSSEVKHNGVLDDPSITSIWAPCYRRRLAFSGLFLIAAQWSGVFRNSESLDLTSDEDATPSEKDQKRRPRIRIADLDSGVNEGISLIGQAIKTNNINSSKTPMAGIYVGEICTGKKIEPGYMKELQRAIDWATDECDVDIISMSIAKEEVTGSGLVDKGAICGHAFMLLEPGRSSAGSSATRGPRVGTIYLAGSQITLQVPRDAGLSGRAQFYFNSLSLCSLPPTCYLFH